MKKKKYKFNYYIFLLILLIDIIFWGIDRSNILYINQKKVILNYIEEKYDFKPDIKTIQKINNYDNHKYVYYIYMGIDDNDFTAYIYEDGKITEDYMQVKLGQEIYNDVSSSFEKEFSTKALNVSELNYTYLGYLDNTSIPKDMTASELLNDSKKTYLSMYLVIENTNYSDTEIMNQLYRWINSYIKSYGIDSLSINIDFIDEENCKTVENKKDDSKYTKRYIYFSDLDVSNFSIDDLKGTIYTSTDYKAYTTPLKDE